MIKIEKINKIDSFTLAEYIIFLLSNASHLKIQKLLYYIQGFHIAYFDIPLVDDQFQAWVHGPVSRVLFDRLKGKSLLYNELSYIESNNEVNIKERIKILSSEQLQLIDEVLKVYGKLTGIDLEKLTHNEYPWLNARKGFGSGEKCEVIISHDDMKSFFKKSINVC